MTLHENSTQTKRRFVQNRKLCDVTFAQALKSISSLLLPVMLGIFTVVITVNQQNATKQQREEDQKAAEENRRVERDIAAERYRDDIFDAYIKGIGQLFEKYNGSLISNRVPMTLARAKTLNIFRRLDPQRNIRIIRFLHESEQLSGTREQISLDLSTAELPGIDFRHLAIYRKQLDNISLASTFLSNATFIDVGMKHVNFSRTRFNDSSWSSAQLENAEFTFAELHNVNFLSARLNFVNFSNTSFNNNSVNFRNAVMPYTKFERTRCIAAHFNYSNLSQSIFFQVNAKSASFNNADLTNTNFSLANLHKTNFAGTKVSCSQLNSALSIKDALLPNGTCVRDPNLVKNGYADCNTPLLLSWVLTHGNITIMKAEADFNNCHFALQSNDVGASMYQKIGLEHWDSGFWKYSLAVLEAKMTNGVSIELNGKSQNGTIIDKKILDATENNTIMRLHEDMKELDVLVKFSAYYNIIHNKNNWCDEIKLFIDYGTAEVESLRGL
ncbi:unnamed protein product [Rotaria magnacalcarata]